MSDKIHEYLMVIEAARYISDGDVVLVGTGLPMVASLFAQKNHAPNMCYVVESGLIGPEVIPTPVSVSDPRVMNKAINHGTLISALGEILHRGLADVGFISGAQIDQYANVNSTVIGDYNNPKVRLPGSGGANDIATHSRKILIIARHEKRRFPEKCDYTTSPGYIDGPDGRKKAGLHVYDPDINVITDQCVFEIDKKTGKLFLAKIMPDVTIEDVKNNTGFEIIISNSGPEVVLQPTQNEISLLNNEVDPTGVYLKH